MKPTNRRNLLLVLVAIALAFAGCGGDDDAATDAATESDGESGGDDGGGDCTPAHDIETIEDGFLTVAAYAYPPFSDFDGDDLAGAEGEIITRIAALECLEVKVVKGDASAMIASITSGRADTTIGSWYRTEEREEVVNLSDPVIADRLTLISTDGVGTVEELKGRNVGSILGFLWNDDLEGVVGDDLKLYETGQSMYADLEAGRIDVIVDTFPSAQAVLANTPIEGVQFVVPPADPAVVSTQKPGQSNFPTNKDNPDLATAFNDLIAQLRSSGELESIVVANGFQAEAADPGEPNKL